MIGRVLTSLFAALALAAPATAGAHIRVQPEEAAAGTYTVLRVNVPNESPDLTTTRVEVRLPEGFAYALYQPVPGWSARVRTAKAAKSALTGRTTPAHVARVIWTAEDPGAEIQPKQFQDFPIAVQIPEEVGATLTFKALQTYGDGEVVRWVGAPGSQEPAPQVLVTAAEEGSAGASEEASAEGADGGNGDGLAIAALVIAILGLAAAGAALTAFLQARRPTEQSDEESPLATPTEATSEPPAS